MTSLITGVSGLAGGHLAAALVAAGEEVAGLVRSGGVEACEGVRLLEADLTDRDAVETAVREVRPDHVYHLGGTTVVTDSFEAPSQAFAVNANGTLYLLGAVKRYAPEARVLVVASSEVYGRDAEHTAPIDEEQPLRPGSPYAVSKAAADLLGYQHWRAYGLHLVRARPFNHTGPGQRQHFIWSNFAAQVARAEAGVGPATLKVGNLDVARDFTDVRDVVRAYALLLDRGKPGHVYNVCSGRAVRLRDLLEILLGFAEVPMTVEVDAARLRAMDPPLIVGDPGRLRAATGWQPEIPLERTLRDLLEWWRSKVRLHVHQGKG